MFSSKSIVSKVIKFITDILRTASWNARIRQVRNSMVSKCQSCGSLHRYIVLVTHCMMDLHAVQLCLIYPQVRSEIILWHWLWRSYPSVLVALILSIDTRFKQIYICRDGYLNCTPQPQVTYSDYFGMTMAINSIHNEYMHHKEIDRYYCNSKIAT